jgi:hypothetical protein
VSYTKDRIQRVEQVFFSAILLYLLLATAPVLAQEQDLQETLQRLESLLLQQQQELQAQGRELAEQRALIRQLQELQKTETSQPDKDPGRESPVTSLAGQTDHDNSSAIPGDEHEDTKQQLAITDIVTTQSATDSDEKSGQQLAIAEFENRQRGVSQGGETKQTVITEDPSSTTYDLNFPGAWHLPGTTAAMKIGGYVNLAVINSFDPLLISDRFIVGSIPPEGENVPGAKSGTDVTANQTRINIEVREETSQGSLRAFVEADFYGADDTFRLRHAFGQYRWALAGKSWSTLMDIDSRPEEVDFEGINGEILARQAQVRIFPQFGESLSFKLALEDPRTDVANGVGAKGRGDLIASVDRLPLGNLGSLDLGSWNSRLAFILRDLAGDPAGEDLDNDSTGNATGWGITTSGRKSFQWWGEKDFLLWQVTYGEGIGRYLNDLNTVGGGDAVIDPDGKLQPLPVFAGYVSYSHGWPADFLLFKSWKGILRSNFTLSWVNIDNFDYQDDKDYKSTLRASANLIYLPTSNVRFGAELLWGQRKNKDESKGTAMQLQVSARYNF